MGSENPSPSGEWSNTWPCSCLAYHVRYQTCPIGAPPFPSFTPNQPVATWAKQFRKLTKQTTQTKLPSASDVQLRKAISKGWHSRDVQIWRRVVEGAKHTADLADDACRLLVNTLRVSSLVGHHPIGLVSLARNALGFADFTLDALEKIEKLFHQHQSDVAVDDDDDISEVSTEKSEERSVPHCSPTQHSQVSSGDAPSQEGAHRDAKRGLKRSRSHVVNGSEDGEEPGSTDLL